MKIFKRLGIVLLILIGVIWFYTNSLIGVDAQAKNFYKALKTELKQHNYKAKIFAISGRRWKLDNYLLTQLGSAVPNSKHKLGQAIDIIVLDVNNDDKWDVQDVDIVYDILDKKIIRDKGGIGTYKNESGFFNQQMVHFDCRGSKARWNR